jgi:hypothetical protein
MTPYLTRLKFAFRTFFSILDRDRIPDEVLAALGVTSAAAHAAPAAAQRAPAEALEDTGGQRAVQMLALLQREGRLIDFLMEDLAAYSDAQIGAAVRDVHGGCRKVLDRYVTLAPVLPGDEGASILVEEGADPLSIKVIGNAGRPPFRGVLRHRGWAATRLDLPPLHRSERPVVAPAEVEVS